MKKLFLLALSILPLSGMAILVVHLAESKPEPEAREFESRVRAVAGRIKKGQLSEIHPFVWLTNRRVSKSWKSVLSPAATEVHEAFLDLSTDDAPGLRRRFIDEIVRRVEASGLPAAGPRLFFGPTYKEWEWSCLEREPDEGFDPTTKPSVIHIALPVLAEKVVYEDKSAWLVIVNWETEEHGSLAHIAFFIVEPLTGEVLLTGQCG